MKNKLYFILLSFFIFIGYCSYPLLIPWINDEPKIILNALHLNQNNLIATSGIGGSKGSIYGPVGIWVYQILLFLGSSVKSLIITKILLVIIPVYISQILICKKLNLNINYSLITFASPFFFFYSRILWDNCFLLPLGFSFLTILYLSP